MEKNRSLHIEFPIMGSVQKMTEEIDPYILSSITNELLLLPMARAMPTEFMEKDMMFIIANVFLKIDMTQALMSLTED